MWKERNQFLLFNCRQKERKKLLRNQKNVGGNKKIKMERKKSSFVMKQSERKKSKEN